MPADRAIVLLLGEAAGAGRPSNNNERASQQGEDKPRPVIIGWSYWGGARRDGNSVYSAFANKVYFIQCGPRLLTTGWNVMSVTVPTMNKTNTKNPSKDSMRMRHAWLRT